MESVMVKCNLCGADDYSVLYNSNRENKTPSVEEYTSTMHKYGIFSRIVICKACGLVYVNPRDAGVKSLYREVVDNAYLESWKERAVTFRRHLKTLRRYGQKKGCLLDIGCYIGTFLAESKKEGYDVVGIEPSTWAAEYARRKTGAEIFEGSWDEAVFPDGAFDVITMWNVIEHLEDPSGCLARVCKWLKVDGVVAVTTHNIKSLFARLLGRRYPWLQRFHLYHFDPETITALLRKNNLRPILLKNYKMTISLKYFLSRFGITTNGALFSKVTFAVNTGDMFMVVATKDT